MSPRPFAPVLAAAALAGLVVGAGLTDSPTRATSRPAASTAPIAAVTLVCPAVDGKGAGLVTTMTVVDLGSAGPGGQGAVSVSAVPLRGPSSRVTQVHPSPVAALPAALVTSPVAVTVTGPGAANVVADQVGLQEAGLGRAASGGACSPPAGDWWFAGAEGRVGYADTLLLANPAASPANVLLDAWSAKGPLDLAGSHKVFLPGRSSVALELARLAPDAGDVTVHVHAVSGSVVAALRDRRTSGIHAKGADWIPSALPPARSVVVPPMPGGPGPRVLYLANPGRTDATVSLRLVTHTRNFQPAGAQSVLVPAGRTVRVALTSAAAGEAAAVLVASDQPVVASAAMALHVHRRLEEITWVAGAAPLGAVAAVATNHAPLDQDVLMVFTAPQDGVRVRVSALRGRSSVVTVPAGRSLEVDLRRTLHAGADVGPVTVTPLDPGPLYAVRVLRAVGAHGALISTELPQTLLRPIPLPAVVEDLRAAVG